MFDLPEVSRRQLLIWVAIGIVIVLVGVRYLAGQDSAGGDKPFAEPVQTIGMKTAQEAPIKVHVVGAVASPGLYDLVNGSRVADAIAVAGGPLPSADLSLVNLAAKMADGQQLIVPAAGESAGAMAAGGAGASPGSLVNLNSATLDQLTELDGIGPKTAQKIIDYREEHGGFSHVEELMEVPGIGQSKFEAVRDRITV